MTKQLPLFTAKEFVAKYRTKLARKFDLQDDDLEKDIIRKCERFIRTRPGFVRLMKSCPDDAFQWLVDSIPQF